MSPPHLTRIVVLFVVFEKSFNEFDTKVDVIQLAVGIQLLVQHVGVERDLIEKISEEFLTRPYAVCVRRDSLSKLSAAGPTNPLHPSCHCM